MQQPEPSFVGAVFPSRTPGLWIGECPELNVLTQGSNEQEATEALVDAIAIRLTAPNRRKKREQAKFVNIPMSRIMEAAVAAGHSIPTA